MLDYSNRLALAFYKDSDIFIRIVGADLGITLKLEAVVTTSENIKSYDLPVYMEIGNDIVTRYIMIGTKRYNLSDFTPTGLQKMTKRGHIFNWDVWRNIGIL